MNDSIEKITNTSIKKEVISNLVKLLSNHREKLDDSNANSNVIQWIDEDIDHIEIGFLNINPDSDYSIRLSDEGYELTFMEALELAYTRLHNSGYNEE